MIPLRPAQARLCGRPSQTPPERLTMTTQTTCPPAPVLPFPPRAPPCAHNPTPTPRRALSRGARKARAARAPAPHTAPLITTAHASPITLTTPAAPIDGGRCSEGDSYFILAVGGGRREALSHRDSPESRKLCALLSMHPDMSRSVEGAVVAVSLLPSGRFKATARWKWWRAPLTIDGHIPTT